MDSVKALMAGLIDYAGLFPPAGLGMREAVKNYAEYLDGPDAAPLGSFIVPIERLEELESELASLGEPSSKKPRWNVSLIVKEKAADAIERAARINASSHSYSVSAIELGAEILFDLKARSEIRFEDGSTPRVFAELSPTDDLDRILPQLARLGARAKIRTGGTVATAFPTAAQIVRFLRACCDSGVGFKATAGLHHPVRGQYPLTYDANSIRGEMYGFLNVFVAAAFIWNGMDDVTAARIINENVRDSFSFSDDAIGWLDLSLSVNRIIAARERFALSFGSCSFREPVDELKLLLNTAAV